MKVSFFAAFSYMQLHFYFYINLITKNNVGVLTVRSERLKASPLIGMHNFRSLRFYDHLFLANICMGWFVLENG